MKFADEVPYILDRSSLPYFVVGKWFYTYSISKQTYKLLRESTLKKKQNLIIHFKVESSWFKSSLESIVKSIILTLITLQSPNSGKKCNTTYVTLLNNQISTKAQRVWNNNQ